MATTAEIEHRIKSGIAKSESQLACDPRALALAIKKAVQTTMIDSQAPTACAFSGGVDSAVIAKVAVEHDPNMLLFCFGMRGSKDIPAAKSIAAQMDAGKNLKIIEKSGDDLIADLAKCEAIFGSFEKRLMSAELGLCVCEIAQEAALHGAKSIMFGSGAEELFAGYSRHYDKYEQGEDMMQVLKDELLALPKKDLIATTKICAHFGIEALFPLIDEDVISLAFGCPPEEKMFTREHKKPQLRAAAKRLGVPNEAVRRPKIAMQYGTGVHKLLLDYFEKTGRREKKEEKTNFI
ncbi:MAG TPA: asparagine synthase C-terminal domain-containing protein [Candidatus Micrarchaeota archaeon]|nr:asparagine synthase C-terminal domain-containing protein [Candidatus Micrarchaeota archaeon]